MNETPNFEDSLTELLIDLTGWMKTVAKNCLNTASKQDIEDLIQEARLHVWKTRGSWNPEKGTLEGFVRMAARRTILQKALGHKNRSGPASRGIIENKEFAVDSENPFWKYAGGYEDHHNDLVYHYPQISEAVAALPEKTRQYVYLRFWQGKTEKEIRDILGISWNPSGLWSNKGGAKEKLRETLAHLEGVS